MSSKCKDQQDVCASCMKSYSKNRRAFELSDWPTLQNNTPPKVDEIASSAMLWECKKGQTFCLCEEVAELKVWRREKGMDGGILNGKRSTFYRPR